VPDSGSWLFGPTEKWQYLIYLDTKMLTNYFFSRDLAWGAADREEFADVEIRLHLQFDPVITEKHDCNPLDRLMVSQCGHPSHVRGQTEQHRFAPVVLLSDGERLEQTITLSQDDLVATSPTVYEPDPYEWQGGPYGDLDRGFHIGNKPQDKRVLVRKAHAVDFLAASTCDKSDSFTFARMVVFPVSRGFMQYPGKKDRKEVSPDSILSQWVTGR
jgi:hypothetical protein